MKFSSVILAVSLAAVASAQSSGTPTQAASSVATPTQTSSFTDTQQKCLDGCDASDVNCKANCLGNPTPSDDMANATTECSKKCDQGSGTAEDTKAYGDCLDKCRNENFFTSAGGAAATAKSSAKSAASSASSKAASATSAAGSAKASATGGSGSSPSGTQGSEPSSTESSASASSSASGAGKIVASGAGFFALVAAVFAL